MQPAFSPETRRGFAAALAAYVLWGALPLFYKWFDGVPAQEILAHRVVWSFVLTGLAVLFTGQHLRVKAIFAARRKLVVFAFSAFAVGTNWFVYIWAVTHSRIVEASMGYYIQPLVSLVLGAIVLRERLNRRQGAAVALVVAGVAVMVAAEGRLPWIALMLAFSFGTYGLLRKIAPAESLVGLFIETTLVLPIALSYILVLAGGAHGSFLSGGWGMTLMLVMTGPATAVPMLLFAHGARRLRLGTVGLMMYVNPTLQMLIAVLLFAEPFTTVHLATFACIWAGIVVYSLDIGALGASFRRNLARRRKAGAP